MKAINLILILMLFLSTTSTAQEKLSTLIIEKFKPNVSFDTAIYNHNDSTCYEIADSRINNLQLADSDSITVENIYYMPITLSVDSLKYGVKPLSFEKVYYMKKEIINPNISPRRSNTISRNPEYRCVEIKKTPSIKKAPIAERILGRHYFSNKYYEITPERIIIIEKEWDYYIITYGRYQIKDDCIILEAFDSYSFSERFLVFDKLKKQSKSRFQKIEVCIILRDCHMGRNSALALYMLSTKPDKCAKRILNKVSRKLKRINRKT